LTRREKFGHFENAIDGYKLPKIRDKWRFGIFPKAIYEFTLDEDDPLTFVDTDGTRIQPDRHLAETDMGSVPWLAQLAIPKDRFLLSFLFHDSAYKHHGLYFAVAGSDLFVFVPLSRKEVDDLLRQMCGAEGAWYQTRAAVYSAVRVGGWASW